MGEKSKNVVLLVLSLLLCYGVEWSASIFTQTSVDSWYKKLTRPPWNPPNFLFPIVWTILYTMIAISFWKILRLKQAYQVRVFTAFFLQLTLNFSWSVVFFYFQSSLLGLLNILLLLTAIVWNIYEFKVYSKLAAKLLIPYFLWVLYATSLNIYIWAMN
ncbi:MAG: tryptophan-rich sensory protein [Chlamydiales bacterium]|nr:tryptophan-rich sensory protein [Chlamydiales bacterium]